MTNWSEVCGEYGALFAAVHDRLLAELVGVQYPFQEGEAFEELVRRSVPESQKVYWTEILYRAHWASALTIARQGKWLTCCAGMLGAQSFLGFSACLRGLVESSADAVHGIGAIPSTLTDLRRSVSIALAGKAGVTCISSDIEERLIHFVYARKKKAGELPDFHVAAHMKTYLSSAAGKDGEHITRCYEELCQIAHPAANSHLWMCSQVGSTVTFTGGRDRDEIVGLLSRHHTAVEDLVAKSINSALLVLWIINRIPVNLFTPCVESLRFDRLPIWNKIAVEWK